ncbi:hypothetical protein DFH28DRAFT_1018020 [Melampsora americana]|nr:hypothetical protein DFH28DRAFT_1018020 [Melampsora americana]
MVACQYFARGMCRFGDGCRNDHIKNGDPQNSKENPNIPSPDTFGPGSKSITDDLVTEKPMYYLSVYAANKYAPNIIDGTDVSPEELRFNAYQARSNNTMPQYIAQETQQFQQIDSLISSITKNTYSAYKHFYQTRIPLNHPTSTFSQQPTSAFGAQTTAFGKPAFGAQQPTGFGAFGGASSSTSATSFGFGQSSSNRPAVTAFGQPATAFGASAFGATPSAPSTSNAFGQPSAFGSSTAVSAFGAKPAPSAFGTQPTTSAFGTQPSTSAFGTQPSTSAFGTQPSTSAFGTQPSTSAFGTQPTTSAFGTQPSAFGQQNTTSAFGSSTFDPWWEEAPKESELSPEFLAAFKAQSFTWDCIPSVPPPISLR